MGLLTQAKQKNKEPKQGSGLLSRSRKKPEPEKGGAGLLSRAREKTQTERKDLTIPLGSDIIRRAGEQRRQRGQQPQFKEGEGFDFTSRAEEEPKFKVPTGKQTTTEAAPDVERDFEIQEPEKPEFVFTARAREDGFEVDTDVQTSTEKDPRKADIPTAGDVARATGQVGKMFAQGVAQGFAASGAALENLPRQIGQAARGEEAPIGEFRPQGELQQAIFGTDEPISLATEGRDITFGLVSEESQAAPFIGAGFGILDLWTGGTGSKALKAAAKTLKGVEKAEDAASTLKKAGFADDIARREADFFARTADDAQIQTRLTELAQEQTGRTAQELIQQTAKATDEGTVKSNLRKLGVPRKRANTLAKELAQETDEATIASRISRELAEEGEEVAQAGARVADDIPEDLAEEVRRFDTPEEFAENTKKNISLDIKRLVDKRTEGFFTLDDVVTDVGRNYIRRQFGIEPSEVPFRVAPNPLEAKTVTKGGDEVTGEIVAQMQPAGDTTGRFIEINPQYVTGVANQKKLDNAIFHELTHFKQDNLSRLRDTEKAYFDIPAEQTAARSGDFHEKNIARDIFNRVKGRGDEIPGAPRAEQRAGARAADDIPPQLAEEARKFDTAEEFKNALPVGGKQGRDIGRGEGFFLARERKPLSQMNENELREVGFEGGTVPKKITVFRATSEEGVQDMVPGDFVALDRGTAAAYGGNIKQFEMSPDELVNAPGNGVFVSRRGIEQTESQLTDIFNRVRGGGDEALATKGAQKRQQVTAQMSNTARQKAPDGQRGISPRRSRRIRQEGKTPKLAKQGEKPELARQSSESYSNSYNQATTKTEQNQYAGELHPLEANAPEKHTVWSKFRHKASNAWVTIREQIQDDFIRVRNLVQSDKAKITRELNPYQAEILFHGRVGSRLEDTRLEVINIDQDIVSTAQTRNLNPDELSSEVNAYLHARHAPERNAQLGDGAAGISTKEANKIVKEIEQSEIGSEVKRIADRIQELNKKTLDVLLEGEVITEELYKTLTTRYKNHVPLQRIIEGEENIGDIISGRGFDVKSTGVKRARGSKREVSDIFTSVVTNYQQAVARAEKNRVDLATLHFARENKESFGHLFEEIKPRAIGETFEGKVIQERITDPQVLTLRENGKPVFLKIKDPNLAVTLRGVSRQKMDGIFRYVAAITRFYSGLQTRFNPEFAFPNKIRDIQEATIYAASKEGVGFKGAARIAGKEARLQNERAVVDWLRGADTEDARLYQQMREDGGTTGGLGLSTRMEVELDLEKIRKINRSSPRDAAEKTVRYVDNWNRVFEDSTRLSVYRQAIEQGASREKAAILAKTASVNFNKTGRAGPIINGLYMFSNASIQGSTKMLGAMKNPKVAATVIAGVGASVAATNEWNDSVDENWRDKVPDWDRLNSLVVVLPTTKEDESIQYVSIPVSWGIKPIKVMMDKGYDLMVGEGDSLLEAADATFVSIIEAYNPAGGTDWVSAITPTLLDLPVDVARNRAWHGGKIRPDWDRYAPDSIQYFESLEDTTTGRTFVGLSSGLSGIGIEVSPANLNYSYEQLVGGAGRTGSEFLNTVIGLGTGDIPPVRDIPVAGRFLRSRTGEEVGAGSADYEQIKEVLTEQSKERFLLEQQAEDAYQQLSNVPKEEASRRFEQIQQNDPDLADEIRQIKEQEEKNLTYTDRMLLQLGVMNGNRARFLFKKFNKLEDAEKKAQLWEEYREKGVISDNVAEQLRFLFENPEKAGGNR